MDQTKQAKLHKLQIKNKQNAEGQISKGANMEVLIDGQPLKGVTFIKFEVKACKVAKVMIEMLADVRVDANLPLSVETIKNTKDMPKVTYQIGSFYPTGVKND
jgi:hypothetical protein